MCECYCRCVCTCNMCIQCHRGQVPIPGTGLTDDCKGPHGYWELNPNPLQKHQVLWIPEASLKHRPPSSFISSYCCCICIWLTEHVWQRSDTTFWSCFSPSTFEARSNQFSRLHFISQEHEDYRCVCYCTLTLLGLSRLILGQQGSALSLPEPFGPPIPHTVLRQDLM